MSADTIPADGSIIEMTSDGKTVAEVRVVRTTGEVMGESAEKMAGIWGVSRADQDAFAVRSQARATRQPRSTVAVEMPSTSAVSSMVSPPK